MPHTTATGPIFPALWWWDDPATRSGAEHMALDELLFSSPLAQPVLRTYRWSGPAMSFGYAERSGPIFAQLDPAREECVRRWTGGGIVAHGHDRTYTLVCPANTGEIPSPSTSIAMYADVHRAICTALCAQGLTASLMHDGQQCPGTLCFAAPVRYDVVVDAVKVAGAGQRRTAHGILHQGSLQGPAASDAVMQMLPALLAQQVEMLPSAYHPPATDIAALAARRYANPVWTRQR